MIRVLIVSASVIFCVVLILAIVAFILEYCDYKAAKKDYPTISFKNFLAFYNIAPKKWTLFETHVEREVICDSFWTETERFAFESFTDYLRYVNFRIEEEERIKKARKTQKDVLAYKRLIRSVKDDIERYDEEAKKQVEELLKNVQIKREDK